MRIAYIPLFSSSGWIYVTSRQPDGVSTSNDFFLFLLLVFLYFDGGKVHTYRICSEALNDTRNSGSQLAVNHLFGDYYDYFEPALASTIRVYSANHAGYVSKAISLIHNNKTKLYTKVFGSTQ